MLKLKLSRTLSVILAALLIMGILPIGQAVAAEVVDNGSCGENATWTLYSDGSFVVGGSGAMQDYLSSDDVPWKSYVNDITAMSIGDQITRIGNFAFYNCINLNSVNISESVIGIGVDAFFNTGYFNTQSNWVNNVLYSGKYLIRANVSLSGDYAVKTGTTCIADGAFLLCDKMTGVTIPDTVTEIGCDTFNYCSALSKVNIPSSITKIGEYAFFCCTLLTKITIPQSVKSIGLYAFFGCDSLTIRCFEGSAAYDYAFENFINCSLLYGGSCGENATWLLSPDGMLTISGTGAMGDVLSVSSPWESHTDKILAVTIESGITRIGTQAFSGCTKLNSISIPGSVTGMGNMAFANTAYYNNASNWENGALYAGKYLIQMKPDTVGAYTIKSGTTCIADGAFYSCSSITDVTVPGSVTSIGESAFSNSPKLTIICDKDSTTQKYAEANNIPFRLSTIDVTGVTLSSSAVDLIKGKTTTLKATVSPADATDKTVKWTSSNTSIATVNATTGNVTAKAPGTVTITATAGGKTATCKITVHSYVSMRLGYSKAIQNGVKGMIDSAGTKPLLISGKTMLPLRFVSEKLGATVTYVSDKKPITVKLGSVTVQFTLGSKKMTVTKGGKTTTKTLDVAAQIKNKKTYIPLRAIGEALDFDVYYHDATRIIIVNTPKMSDSIKAIRLNEAKAYIK